MGEYQVCVYAICKDEAQFVDRWMDSVAEADRVVVLDTGSTDDTAARLRARGAVVVQGTITPWRFDAARNRALSLVPEDTDICVSVDLDEVFQPGWRDALEQVWQPNAKLARCHYVWSFFPDGRADVSFYAEKIHARHGVQWRHPVHEVLETVEGHTGLCLTVCGMCLEHRPDPNKSRAQYLPLLEMSVREDPNDDRNAHYLGREYFFYRRWDACIAELNRHLALPCAVWPPERAASMCYIARAYVQKGEPEQAKRWFLRACAEAPDMRELWVHFAQFLYDTEDWDGVIYATGEALKRSERQEVYLSEGIAWGSLPHDLRAIALHRVGRYAEALRSAHTALTLEPADQRLQENVNLLERLVHMPCWEA